MHDIDLSFMLLFARLALAAVMLYYGWPKVRDLRSNASDFVRMGFSPGWLWGTMVAAIEFIGGLAVAAGIWTELFAAMFGFQMLLGTFWKYKIHKPFSDYSYDILALAVVLMLIRSGGGVWTLAPTPFALASWELVAGSIIVALIATAASRPRTQS